MPKYKLVDTFTGWEGTSLYNSLDAAQEALEAARVDYSKELSKSLDNKSKKWFIWRRKVDKKCHKAVVPNGAKWRFINHKWQWAILLDEITADTAFSTNFRHWRVE